MKERIAVAWGAPGRGWIAVGALALASTSACQADRVDGDRGDDRASPAESLVAVRSVVLGDSVDVNGEVVEERERFRPGERVVLSVDTEGSVDEVLLVARWTREDGAVIQEAQSRFPISGSHIETFRLRGADSLSPGSYRVDLFLGRERVATRTFEIGGDE